MDLLAQMQYYAHNKLLNNDTSSIGYSRHVSGKRTLQTRMLHVFYLDYLQKGHLRLQLYEVCFVLLYLTGLKMIRWVLTYPSPIFGNEVRCVTDIAAPSITVDSIRVKRSTRVELMVIGPCFIAYFSY